MGKAKTGYTPKMLVSLFAGVCLMFIFGQICPTWAAVTEPGVKIIGVFLGWILMVITGFGLMIPSLLAMPCARNQDAALQELRQVFRCYRSCQHGVLRQGV